MFEEVALKALNYYEKNIYPLPESHENNCIKWGITHLLDDIFDHPMDDPLDTIIIFIANMIEISKRKNMSKDTFLIAAEAGQKLYQYLKGE